MSIGLLCCLPLMQKHMRVKSVVVVSAAGSTLQIFMFAMLAWPSVAAWPGVAAWPYVCAAAQLLLPLWFPIMRATAATLFGAERFALALGAVATTQVRAHSRRRSPHACNPPPARP
jgi:hypothetical protein